VFLPPLATSEFLIFTWGPRGATYVPTGVIIPISHSLFQNYPNPFNPTTNIRYAIPPVIASGTKQSQFVSLKVYDILGIEIATLVNENRPAGNYEVNFDASDLTSGIYFCRLQTNKFSSTKKMLMVK